MRRVDWAGVNTLRIRQISGRPNASDGTKLKGPAQGKPQVENGGRFRLTRRRVNLALIILALLYAFFAGLHTVFDLDMGWHLATGRYVVQHHVIPHTDVLSYTSAGMEWIYPPFAGVLLYGVFSAWGHAGLSWFCTLGLVAMVACLLRSPSRKESGIAAGLAIIAVPGLAQRATPRADLFTTLFFAVFLVRLWRFHRSGAVVPDSQGEPCPGPSRLWILPLLMLLWVNLHPGFIAGLGVLSAYLLIEGLDLLFLSRRPAVLERLKQAGPPLAATVVATLFNPYGLRIFKASLRLAGLPRSSLPGTGPDVVELLTVRLTLPSLAQALDWRDPLSSYWWLAFVAVVVIALALWRRQFGAVLLMAAALYVSIQHLRYQALFACVVVVVGSTILAEGLQEKKQSEAKFVAKWSGILRVMPVIAASLLCLLTCVRIADLASNRFYHMFSFEMRFGTGESWWFPERAAAFIQREHLPGNIFHPYNLGGFAAWRLGPTYGDFIDGRGVSSTVWAEQKNLLSSSLDSPVWEAESDRRNLNVVFLPLGRSYGIETQVLLSLCQSRQWRPVYLDEVSIVLLRNRHENQPWIDKYEVNCQTQNFAPPHASRGNLCDFYANAGHVLLPLRRLSEAQDVLNHGLAICPEEPTMRLSLALLYNSQHRLGDAERELKISLSQRKYDPWLLYNVGQFYDVHGRYADARPYIYRATQLSGIPIKEYTELGSIDVKLRHPGEALIDYDKAEKAAQGRQDLDPEFFAQLAEGRSAAYLELGDQQRALEVLQEAIRRAPNDASLWQALGDFYDAIGQPQPAGQAHQRARALSN
ncbi:MAG TPA: tetratricopeptide repeat protein [Candidatus Sulfotelmatobacter sp.]|nr:tetratricopeptide repeat protein [Candidatus Sulfotelmatobacter sp.]